MNKGGAPHAGRLSLATVRRRIAELKTNGEQPMTQVTVEERENAERHKAELQAGLDSEAGRSWSNRNNSDPELIDELLERWAADEPFYISAVVVAPYDGCFHEPNIFLCTPPGSNLYDEMNRHDAYGSRVVWQLYASGQGMCVDCLVSLSDVVEWLAEQSLNALATREESHTAERRQHHYGSFDSFELHDYGPIDELPADETYWAHAVRSAEEQYGVCLPWTCDKCEKVHEGTTGEHMMEPIHTGYHGNGGVGIIMVGALCYECFEEGSCSLCAETCVSPHDIYSEDVAKYGTDICDSCCYDIFRGAVTYDEGFDEILAAEETVQVAYENGELLVRFMPSQNKDGDWLEDKVMAGIHVDDDRVATVLRQWRMSLDGVFGDRSKVVLASSLKAVAEEAEAE